MQFISLLDAVVPLANTTNDRLLPGHGADYLPMVGTSPYTTDTPHITHLGNANTSPVPPSSGTVPALPGGDNESLPPISTVFGMN